MANISKITLPDGNTYDIKDANAYQKPSGGIPASDLASGVIPSTPSAADVTYDNTQSGLNADDIQEAIDELAAGGSTSGKADQTTIASVEASTTATEAHALGSIFYLNGVLYRALADITVGDTINTGTGGNATQTKISENFKRTVTLTAAQYAQLSAAEKAADIVYIITDEPPPAISTSTPQMDGTAAAGSTGEVSDAGHTHPSDTSRMPVNGMGENLLRNWYFKNPVNQRGKSNYTGTSYAVDSWKIDTSSATATIVTDGISLSKGSRNYIFFGQFLAQTTIDALLGKIVTFSYIDGSGLHTATYTWQGTSSVIYTDGTVSVYSGGNVSNVYNFCFSNTGADVTIQAVKLELGTQQTLAHLEGSTWVLNEIPSYEQELIKCQTSTADNSDVYANKVISVNIPNKNLLRNWYLVGQGPGRGGFPVNSNGQTQYENSSGSGLYCINSWKNGRSKIFLTDTGLTFAVLGSGNTNGYLTQNIDVNSLLGKMVTCSLLMSAPGDSSTIRFFSLTVQIPATLPSSSQSIASGVYFDTTDTTSWLNLIIYSNGILTFGIYQTVVTASQGRYYKAIKIEPGTEQTLCHQENGVWVLNEVPDYEEEYYRCITSTVDSSDIYANKVIATNVSNKNLLSNWYFVGGGSQQGAGYFPINSRNSSSYTTSGEYCIDRWKIYRGTVTLASDGIVLTWNGNNQYGPFHQPLENYDLYKGNIVTFSAMLEGGNELDKVTFVLPTSGTYASSLGFHGNTFKFYANATSKSVEIGIIDSSTSVTINALKLELGTQQTLASYDGVKWVLNELPNYQEELSRCFSSTADTIAHDPYTNKSLATEQQLAYVESGTTASRAYAVGEYFCWNGLLYRAKTAISSGGTFTPGTNCEQVTEGGLNSLRVLTGTVVYQCSNGVNTISRTTQVYSGALPEKTLNRCIWQVVAHSYSGTYQNTVETDGDFLVIHAGYAQRLTLRWWYLPID